MASLAQLMVEVGADISEFTKNMQKVEQTMKGTGKGLMGVGKSMTDAGKKMATSVSLPLLALGTSAVVIGATFDAQMSKVSAVSGATGKAFDDLRSQAKELGSTTAWTATEAGQGMEFLARAGWKADQIMSAMPNVLNLATASAIDLGTAADIASNIISGFGDTAQNSQRYIDVLAKTTASSNTDMLQLGDAMKYVAPVANTVGWSVEETATAIGKMSDAGIQGSQAGTALRGGLLRLVSPTGDVEKTMKKLGLSFFDTEGNMKSMPKVIGELEKGLDGMTQQQKAQTMSILFGQEAVSGWLALMDIGSDKLGEFTLELENSEGTAQNMAETMNDNLAGSMKGLLSALEGLAISFSDVMTPALKKVTEFLTGLTRKFDTLSPATKGIIVVIGMLVASIAPLLIFVGFVAQGIGALAIAFGAISAPVLAIIAGVALFVAGLALAYAKIEPFRNAVNNAFLKIKEAVTTALTVVVAFVQEKLAQIKQFWDENGAQILQAVQNVWNFIAPIVQIAMNLVLMVVQYVWNAIKGVINGALNIIMGLVKIFAGLFTGDFSKMWEGIKQLFVGAVQFVWNLMSLTFVRGILKSITSLAKGAWAGVKSMWETIRIHFMYGKDKAIALVNTLKTQGVSIFNGMKNMLVSIAQAIWNFVRSIFTNLSNSVTTIFNGIRSVASSVWNGIKSVVISVVNGIRTGVSTGFNAIKTTATTIFNAVKTAITKPIESAKKTVLGIIDAIVSAFSKMKITIPKPKLPKISVAMKTGFMGIQYPSFDVAWNAKGGIFNGASILGGGQGVGEAGAEAVLPIQHKRYMKPFASAVASHLNTGSEKEDGGDIVNNFVIHATIREDADIEKLAEELNRKQEQKRRMGGRV